MDLMREHPLFWTWWGMRMRCENPNHKGFKHYGGRGIKIWGPWRRDFYAFAFYMGNDKPSPAHTMDRYPNRDGNYEPGNVRWATWKEQAENRVKLPKKPPKPRAPKPQKVKEKKVKEVPDGLTRDGLAYWLLQEKYTKTQIADLLGISKQAITRWKAVPLRYARPLSEKTGISKADLLPSEFA